MAAKKEEEFSRYMSSSRPFDWMSGACRGFLAQRRVMGLNGSRRAFLYLEVGQVNEMESEGYGEAIGWN